MAVETQAEANARCAHLAANALALGCDATRPRLVYVSPGSRSTPLVLALDAHPAIDLRVVLDERAAAFAALGAATATGRAVCTVCTSGSAAAHALPAVMEANHAGVALVVLTADRPLESQGVGAAQTTSQSRLYEQHTKVSFHLPAPVASTEPAQRQVEGQWRLLFARAVHEAQRAFCGPVHINLPFRDPLGTRVAQADDTLAPVRLGALRANTPCEATLSAAIDLLKDAQRVAVVVGPALPASHATASFADALRSLASQQHWPVFVESSSNVAWGRWLDDDALSPVVVSCADAWATMQQLPDSMRPDAWLHIGLPPAGRALLRWVNVPTARHIVFHPDRMPLDGAHVGHVFFEGDEAPWLGAWARRDLLCSSEQKSFSLRVAELHRHLHHVIDHACSPDDAWFEGQALRLIVRAAAPDACLVLGNSLTVRDIDTFAAIDSEHAKEMRVLVRRGVSGIDGALAHAAGVAADDTARPLVCCFGDLTFLNDIQSLRLLVQQKRRVQIFVLDNNGGEIFSQLPIADASQQLDRLFRTPQTVDAEALCRAQGANFISCATAGELNDHLRSARHREESQVVDVVWLRFPPAAREARKRVMLALSNAAKHVEGVRSGSDA